MQEHDEHTTASLSRRRARLRARLSAAPRATLVATLAVALGAGLLAGCGGDDERALPVDVDEDVDDGVDEDIDDDWDDAPEGPVVKPPPPDPSPRVVKLTPPAPEPGPDPALVDAARATKLLARLDELGEGALRSPPPAIPPAGADEKQTLQFRQKRVQLMRAWEGALGTIISKASDYVAAAGRDAAAPRAFYKRGTARVFLADRKTAAEAWELRHYGAGDLRRFLDTAKADDPQRPDACGRLGRALLLTSQDDEALRLQAVPYLSTAVGAYVREGRSEEAGEAAYLLFSTLLDLGREEDVENLAERWGAARTDFGPTTRVVRGLALRARIRPNAPMPVAPVVEAMDGSPLFVPGDLSEKPYVVHFFKTDVSSRTKEIEKVLVPLSREWSAEGLEMIGVSVDWEMPPDYRERQLALAEEVGSDWVVHDGSRASVRKWAEERGLAWRWYWDGKWAENAVAAALGVPTNAPYAILVDPSGVIRWRGDPAEGLAEAVAKLLGN